MRYSILTVCALISAKPKMDHLPFSKSLWWTIRFQSCPGIAFSKRSLLLFSPVHICSSSSLSTLFHRTLHCSVFVFVLFHPNHLNDTGWPNKCAGCLYSSTIQTHASERLVLSTCNNWLKCDSLCFRNCYAGHFYSILEWQSCAFLLVHFSLHVPFWIRLIFCSALSNSQWASNYSKESSWRPSTFFLCVSFKSTRAAQHTLKLHIDKPMKE